MLSGILCEVRRLGSFGRLLSIDEVLEAALIDHAQLSPEAVAYSRERDKHLGSRDAISPKQRIAVRVRFKADLELTEIAKVMGINHLFRAVQSIRHRLKVENVIGSLALMLMITLAAHAR
jgi:DNA-directed RNA polymerase specialized sigma subunit